MKNKIIILILCTVIFAGWYYANNRLPGPVDIVRGNNFITLDVSDSTMMDLNNRIKLYQNGDTLLILTKSHQVLAKLSPDTVSFIVQPSYAISGQTFDTIKFSTGTGNITGANNALYQLLFNGTAYFPLGIRTDAGLTLQASPTVGVGEVSNKMTFTDSDYPSGISLDSLVNKAGSGGGLAAGSDIDVKSVDITQTGTGNCLTAAYQGTTTLTVKDKLWLNYLSPVAATYGYLYMLKSTKEVKVDSTVTAAGHGLQVDIPDDPGSFLNDQLNGEICWYPYKDRPVYTLEGLLPGEINSALMAQIEICLRYIAKQDDQIRNLQSNYYELESRVKELEFATDPVQINLWFIVLAITAFIGLFGFAFLLGKRR